MLKLSDFYRFGGVAGMPYTGVIRVCCLLLLPLTLNAVNLVHVDIGQTGQSEPYDTIYIGNEFEFRIHIENDVTWQSFALGYEIWSVDGVIWQHLPQPDGWGIAGHNSFPACFTLAPGCRMDPIEDHFNMATPNIHVNSFDAITPDSFLLITWDLGGPGIDPGGLEHMISAHFKVIGPWSPGEVKEICIRHIDFPFDGDFVYMHDGSFYVPDATTPACFPVKILCGDANSDRSVNLADAAFIINFIFFGGRWPEPWQLGDTNGDGGIGMGDAGYIINYVFYNSPAPVCPE